MEFCHNCGAENKEGNKFCIKCGSALEPAEKGFNIKKNYYFAGPLITSLIGGIALLFLPFAELYIKTYTESGSVAERYSYHYGALYPESPLLSIILLCFVALLFYGAYVSILGLPFGEKLLGRKFNLEMLKRAFYGATTVFLGTFIIATYIHSKESLVESLHQVDPNIFVVVQEGAKNGFIFGGLTAGLLGIAYYMRRKQMLLPGEKKGSTALRNGSFTGQNVEPK